MKLRTLDLLLTAPEQKKYSMQCCDSELMSTSRRTMSVETWSMLHSVGPDVSQYFFSIHPLWR
jgi:hypothetical protein